MTRCLIVAGVILLGANLLDNRSTRTVHADSACSASSFSGNYGYNFTGIVYDSAGNQYVLQAVGRMVADGNGNITSGVDSGSNDGEPFTARAYTGTYTVNADCTGSAVFNYPNNSKRTNALVLVSAGKEAYFTQTDTDFVFGGVAKQQ